MAKARSLADRFWEKVDKRGPEDCWPWLASGLPTGYGSIRVRGSRGWGRDYAHRVAWALSHGAIPAGLHVLHSCDNPPCCNPAHLSLGTALDNIADMVRKGRQRRGEAVPTARLRQSDVALIRGRRGDGTQAVASAFGVAPRTIRDIWNGKTWAASAAGGQ